MNNVTSGERRLSHSELIARASRAASGFAALGVQAGEPIALYLRNDLAFLEASLGASQLGAYCLPVNWHYAADEASYLFSDSGARTIVIHADLLSNVREALPRDARVLVVSTPTEIQCAYHLDPDVCEVPAGMTDWDAWVASQPLRVEPPLPPPDVMLYTSGTTGRPKGVRRQTPTPAQSQFQEFVRMRGFGFDRHTARDVVAVVTGPMYHSAPNAYGVLASKYGASVILQPRFDAEELLRLIERHRVTHLQMVPVMFNRLLALPVRTRSRYDLSSLQFVVHSAAPMAPEAKRRMLEWWGPIINEYYGTTETSMMTYCTASEWIEKPGSVGRPLPESDLVILDGQGLPLPTGEIGQIACWVNGIPDFTYQNDSAKRRESFAGHRFLTGDVGFIDADGYLFISDRAKDLIISGGVNVYPAEIEAELSRMPGVVDCAVFGIPDTEFGESVCAVVVADTTSDLNEDQIRKYLRDRMAGYKVPRYVDFRAELPREDSGKIFKRKIRDEYWEASGRLI